jgi:uncharacterized membrane protein YkvI
MNKKAFIGTLITGATVLVFFIFGTNFNLVTKFPSIVKRVPWPQLVAAGMFVFLAALLLYCILAGSMENNK